MKRLYLDHAATTPLLPEVVAAMSHAADSFGNPSSLHQEGRAAKDRIDEARECLAEAIGCLFAEVIFTSGGTEAANLAVIGSALANSDSKRKKVIFSAIEHHCVLHTAPILNRLGYHVVIVPADGQSMLDIGAFEAEMGPDVLLASVMHANNETGTLQPTASVSEICARHGALFHCDAVQTFLRRPNETLLGQLNADLVSISAHKVNGPKGVGALYVRAGVKLQSIASGGSQEREVRAGTENVAGIIGFGTAVKCHRGNPERQAVKGASRDAFLAGLSSNFIRTVPDVTSVLAGHAHVRLPGVDAETMLIRLDRMGVSASSGAACSSGSLEPSHVLLACGLSEQEAKEGLRFSFGWPLTVADAHEAAVRVNECGEAILKSWRSPGKGIV